MPHAMQKEYVVPGKGYAELEPSGFRNRWWLAGLWVERQWRGQGVAQELLRRIVADADATGTHLGLAVMPCDDGVYDLGLFNLYAKVGFYQVAGGTTMYRDPVKEVPQPWLSSTMATSQGH